MHMQGARKIKLEDISFESDAHNIYDPFFSSQSEEDYYTESSGGRSCYDSEVAPGSEDEDFDYDEEGSSFSS